MEEHRRFTNGTGVTRAALLERRLVLIRWFGVAFGLFQVWQTSMQPPAPPPYLTTVAYGLVAALAVGNVIILAATRRAAKVTALRWIGLGAFALDTAVIMGIAWVYTWFPNSTTWVVLYILPLEGALRYQLPGALSAVAVAIVSEFGREIYRTTLHPEIDFEFSSVTFRVGIMAIIALVAGLMARQLQRERDEAIGRAREMSELAEREAAARVEREQSEARYRSLVETVPAAVYVASLQDWGTLQYVSPQVESLLGFSVTRWLDPGERLWEQRIHPDDRDRVLTASRRHTDSSEPFGDEYRMIAADGRVVWVRDEAVIVRDETGTPLFSQGLMYDVTERKQNEEGLRFLSSASELLASSLDYEETLEALSRLAVLQLADWCAIHLLGPDGGFHRLIVAHAEPEKEHLARELNERYPPDPSAPGPIAEVIRTGKAMVIPEISEEDLAAAAVDEKHLEILRSLGLHSGILVPLVGRRGTLGTLSLVSAESQRRYNEADLALAEELGRRAAWAAENARLYSEVRQSEAELKRSLQRLQRLDEQRRQLLSRVVTAQEAERRRIASDIHDDSVQVLTAAGVRLETLRRILRDAAEASAVEKAERTVREAIARLRHLTFELRPPLLDREGLAPAIQSYLEETAKVAGFDHDLDVRLEREPSPETRLILYRIVQEALTNVRKHAQAGRVDVSVEQSDGGFHVAIRDDGEGFVVGVPVPGHLGLLSMRERAEMAGGWFRIESDRSSGTSIDFWVPEDGTAVAAETGS